jgi:chorismate synthase
MTAAMLRFLTAGESHGKALVVIVDGVPAGLTIDVPAIAADLRRRQGGYGRGQRMTIETDEPLVLGGVRRGVTTGAPVALTIENRDWVNWQRTMHVEPVMPPGASGGQKGPVTCPRPGHADLAGIIKYELDDVRDVLERASARETASRVAAGAVARQILRAVGIDVSSHVFSIGNISLDAPHDIPFDVIVGIPADSPTRCADERVGHRMIEAIDAARRNGDTIGGAFEVVAHGVPPGLGSYAQWDRRLDGRLAQALMSIPAIKSVGLGIGADSARLPGSVVHDPVLPPDTSGATASGVPVRRPSNHAGGLEGGVTNGEDLRISAFMKPIATLMAPLPSVDLSSLEPSDAAIERSDVCAVPAASVVGEAMVAIVLADSCLERFGSDTMAGLQRNYRAWATCAAERFPLTIGAPQA